MNIQPNAPLSSLVPAKPANKADGTREINEGDRTGDRQPNGRQQSADSDECEIAYDSADSLQPIPKVTKAASEISGSRLDIQA